MAKCGANFLRRAAELRDRHEVLCESAKRDLASAADALALAVMFECRAETSKSLLGLTLRRRAARDEKLYDES